MGPLDKTAIVWWCGVVWWEGRGGVWLFCVFSFVFLCVVVVLVWLCEVIHRQAVSQTTMTEGGGKKTGGPPNQVVCCPAGLARLLFLFGKKKKKTPKKKKKRMKFFLLILFVFLGFVYSFDGDEYRPIRDEGYNAIIQAKTARMRSRRNQKEMDANTDAQVRKNFFFL